MSMVTTRFHARPTEEVRERPALETWVRTGKRWFRRPTMQDGLTAGALAVIGLLGAAAQVEVELPQGSPDVPINGLELGAILLILGQTVPLVWRRIAPVAVFVVVTTSLMLFYLLSYFPSFASLSLLVALYTVAAHRERRISVPAAVACGLLLIVVSGFGAEPPELDAVIAMFLVVGAAWILGDGVRSRQGRLLNLQDRAARLEAEQEGRAKEAVAQERRVIARELHDVVAHNVSVIVAQAGGARLASREHPQDGLVALDAIEHLGREALVEMRRLTGFLRTEADDVGRSPQPGMEDLPTLLSQVRAAGLDLTLRVEGEERALPAGLSLSAFRIIQEALTNVLKHAGRVHADVVIRYGDGYVGLVIEDDGPAQDEERRQASRPGYGHLGMRERVALFGGDLRLGPGEAGGYRVVAYLPDEVPS